MSDGIVYLEPKSTRSDGPGARVIEIEGEPIGIEPSTTEPFHDQFSYFNSRETFGKKRARTQISPQWLQQSFPWNKTDKKTLLEWDAKQQAVVDKQLELWGSRSEFAASTKAARIAYQADPSPENLQALAKAKSEEAANELTFDDIDISLRATRESQGKAIIDDAIRIGKDMSKFVLETAQQVEQAEQETFEKFLATYVPSELVRALLDLSDDILKHSAKLDDERLFGNKSLTRDHLFFGHCFPEEGK
jgi:hypothetical protein